MRDMPTTLSYSIKEIYDAYESGASELVEDGTVHICSVQEIVSGGYLKMLRTRDKALAPGKIRNKTPGDIKAGQEKWDDIYQSMKTQGYDYSQPVEFLIKRSNEKRKLHQGHHRVTIAEHLGIRNISVVFRFIETMG